MRAALYARYSTDNQSEASVEDQMVGCRAYTERLGAHAVREFSDAGISGVAMANRPGFLALMAFVRSGGCDVVIAEHTDRLSRAGSGGWQVFEELQDLGVRYMTVHEGEVTEALQGVSSLVSASKIKEARVRTRRGLEGVVRSGRSAGGLPYGYSLPRAYDAHGDRLKGLREVDPAQAAVVVRIFTDYANGSSPLAIAYALNAEGAPGPRGGRWNASTIQGDRRRGAGILHNDLYRGVRVWGRTPMMKDRATGKRRPAPRRAADADVLRHQVPELRIVGDDLWARVQARLAASAVGPDGEGRGRRRPRTLLGGLIRCACCGGAMTRGGSGDHLRCGVRAEQGPAACGNTRTPSYAAIEARVLKSIQANLLHPDVVAEAAREFQRATAAHRRAAAQDEGGLRRDLAEATRGAERLIDQVQNGGMPWSAAADRHAALTARQAELQARLDAVQPPTAEVVTLHPAAAGLYRQMIHDLHLVTDATGAAAPADSRPRQEARDALRALVDAVVFTPGQARGAFELEIVAELAPLLAPALDGALVRATNSRSRYKRSHYSPTQVRLAG